MSKKNGQFVWDTPACVYDKHTWKDHRGIFSLSSEVAKVANISAKQICF